MSYRRCPDCKIVLTTPEEPCPVCKLLKDLEEKNEPEKSRE